MKRILGFCFLIIIMLAGCNSSQSIQYRTQLSPANKLDIVREPPAADFSFIHPEKMTELPIYNPNSN